MWKRLKLLTLVVLTTTLAWLTFPTWQDLVDKQTLTPWNFGDDITIGELYPEKNTTLSIDLVAQVESQGDSRDSAAVVFAVLNVNALNLTSSKVRAPLQQQIVVSAHRAAKSWLNDCKAGNFLPNGTLNEDLSRVPTSKIMDPSSDGVILTSLDPGLQCTLPEERLWSNDGGSIKFSTPMIAFGTDTGAANESTNTATIFNPKLAPTTGTWCAHVTLIYGPGITIDSTIPSDPAQSATTDKDVHLVNGSGLDLLSQTFGGRKLEWPASCLPKGELSTANTASVIAARTPVQAQLSDAAGVSAASKQLFFAGLFLGLLGALVVEVIGSGFEVAEGWSERRREASDEQPEPDDQPYDPGPRGYL